MYNKVIILNFSTRSSGNCANIASAIAGFHGEQSVQVLSVSMDPCGGCDYECLKQGKSCPKSAPEHIALMNRLLDASMVYFVVPNYCGFPCANYFAFNERSVGFFNGDRSMLKQYLAVPKRFIIVSNTQNDHFADAMAQQVSGEPEILYLKTSRYKKVSIAGDMMESEAAKEDLRKFLSSGSAEVKQDAVPGGMIP